MPDLDAADAATEQDLAALADEAAIQAREALLPGMLTGAILGDLEAALEAAREIAAALGPGEKADQAATIAHLATAADALDRIRARADAETAGPAIAPDVARRAAVALVRCAEMLHRAPTVMGRFAEADHPEPDMAPAPWTEARLIPDGYEDLDPATLQRLAGQLHEVAR